MILISADEHECKIKMSGETKDVAAEFCAAVMTACEKLVETIKDSNEAVRFATYMTASKKMSEASMIFAIELLKLMSNRTPAKITVDVSDLDELKKQMQEMENGSDN